MEEKNRMQILSGVNTHKSNINESKDTPLKELEAIEVIDKFDYLQKAFKYIVLNSKSNDNPYHDLNHLLTVMKYCYQGAVVENVNGKALKELLIAAIFHDANHSGGKKTDEENIEEAKRVMKKFVESENIDVNIESMNEILDATQYPYVIEPEDLNLSQAIIRDADIMQIYQYNWIQQNIYGLAQELNMSFVDFLKSQKKFMDAAEFNTKWGKELKKEKWASVMRQFKMLEDAFLVKLESDK
jgi:hypothetical protein